MLEKNYKKGDYIISDYYFESYFQNLNILKNKTEKQKIFDLSFLSLYKRLKEIKVSEKKYFLTNRRLERPYYIYQVIN